MMAPGVTSDVAHFVAAHENDPHAMANAMVNDVMRAHWDPNFGPMHAAAAFDVLDLDPKKLAAAEAAIKNFNDAAYASAKDPGVKEALRHDVRDIGGMARIPDAGSLPWHADRSAISVYDTIARDGRLDQALRKDAALARDSVAKLVLAHRESRDFGVFDDSDYSDAVGPTIHTPTSRAQIDPWAREGVSETRNDFYRSVDQDRFVRVLT